MTNPIAIITKIILKKFAGRSFSRRVFPAGLLFFSVLVSIAPPVIFLMLHKPADRTQRSAGSGYAMLVLDEKQNDREVCALLEKHNIKNYSSESTGWFLLNDFSGIKKIPLDEYPARLEVFDPRNDGYAEKARAVFVSGGKRRIFIPARSLGGFGAGAPEERIIDALEGTPYTSIHLQRVRRNNTATIIIFIAACIFLVFSARKIALSQNVPRCSLYALIFIPALATLTGSGAAGFALASVSLGFFQILRTPLLRFFTRERYGRKIPLEFNAASIAELFRFDTFGLPLEDILPEKHKLIPLAALFLGICIAGGIEAATVLWFMFFFSLSFAAMLTAEVWRGKLPRHIPFMFEPIRSAAFQKTKYPTLPVPFVAALVAQIIVSSWTGGGAAIPESFPEPGKALVLPDESDWINHVETQRDFSLRNLNTAPGQNAAEDGQKYLHYRLGGDGLIQTVEDGGYGGDAQEAPAWALGELVSFMRGAGKPENSSPVEGVGSLGSGAAAGRPGALLAGFFALCLYLPFLVQRSFQRHRKKMPCLLLYNN
jgi:hypothetical protein